MTRIRRVAAVIVVGVLILGLTGATSAPREGEGSVTTSLELLSLGLTDVPLVGDLEAALGTLTSAASTVDTNAASLLLEGLRAGDQTVTAWTADSSSGPTSGDQTLALPGGLGGVSLTDWLAEAGDRSAAARVSALTGGLDLGPLVGLAVELGDRGVSSQVTEDRIAGLTEVSIDGLGLAIGDLLPAGLLDELPLGTLLDLLDQLPIALPADLAAAVAEVEALIAELEGIVALDGDVQGALADLLALPGVDSIADAEVLVASLTTLIDDLTTEIAAAKDGLTLLAGLDLTDPLGAVDALVGLLDLHALYGSGSGCAEPDLANLLAVGTCYATYLAGLVTTLGDQLADATADLGVVNDLLGPVLDLLDDLVALLEDLAGLLVDLPDLGVLRDALAGLVGGADLFDLGRLAIEVEVAAGADDASAAVTCTATDVAVLGQAPLPELDCDALGVTFEALEAVVGDLLGALPIGDLPVLVEVGGLRVSTATASDPEAGVSSAAAGISALRAQVGSVGLEAVLDLLTEQLGDLLGEVSGVVAGLDLDGLGVGGDQVSTAAIGDDLAALLATVDGLPLGDGLDGLRTTGVDLRVASIDVLGDFAAAQEPDGDGPGGDGPGGDGPGGEGPGGAGPDGDPTGDGPGGDGPGLDPVPVDAPGTPAPGGPAGRPDLPRTGGGAPALLLGLALLGAGTALRRVR